MRKYFIFYILVFISSKFSLAVWSPINNGLFSGTIRCFAVKDSIIYAGVADYAVLYSTNNGLSWSPTGDKYLNVRSLAIAGDNIIVGTWGGGIFISSDGGINWTQSNTGLNNLYIISLLVKNDFIFAGTWGDGIFISSDFGNTWFQSSFKYGRPYTFATNESQIFAATDKGVFFSTDNGTTWVSTKITDLEIFSIAVDNDFVVVGTTGAIYYSPDNGETWVKRQIPLVTVQGLAIEGNLVFAATNKGLYLSTDRGNTWNLKSKNEIFETSFAVFYSKGNIIVGTSEKGIFLSTDLGNTWQQVGGDIGYVINSLTSEGSKVFAATEKGLFTASNFGEYWFKVKDTFKNVNVVHSCNSYIFAGLNNSILFSSDQGFSWKESIVSDIINYDILTFGCNSDYVYASGFGSFLAYSKFPVTEFKREFLFFQVNSIVVIDQEMYYGSTEGVGKYLIPQKLFIPLGLDGKNVHSLYHTDGKLLAGTDDGFYVSTDYGGSWEKKSNGLLDMVIYSVAAWDNVYFAGTSSGLFFSTDYGENWYIARDGPVKTKVNTIHIAYPFVFVGTLFKGVFRALLDNFIASVENEPSTENLNLCPNPASNLIHISLPESLEPAEIDISNFLGISEKSSISIKFTSKNNVTIDISNLSVGTYFVKVVTRNGKMFFQKFLKN